MTILTAEGMEKKPSAGGNLQPPSFAGEAQQCITAYEGTDITITIELAPTGGTPTTICWRRGEQELVGDRYSASENNNTVLLNLHHVTRDDVGHYTLLAKNAAGEAHRAFEIKVEDAGADVPVFLRRLSDLAVKVGTRTRFLVEIRSSTDIKVSWHRNDELLQEGERFHFVHEGNFFCVDVAPVMVEDGGRWTCMAEGTGGRTSCSSHLNVLVPKAYKAPEFLEELQALLTEQGTVSLECKVVGVPTPVLKWYKDGKEIKAGDVFALTANPDDPTSLGTYTCEAVNCMGKTYSSSKVHVMGKGSREGSLKPADSLKPVGPPPVFKKELKNEKIKIGDTITLACKVVVPPWPQSITWYNKEGRVDEGEKYHIMADGLGGYMIEIKQAEAVDEGDWKCVATSNEGAKGISQCHVSINYPKNYRKPRFLESLKAILTDEGLVSFECKVVGFPTPQLRWFKDGQELKPGDVYQLTGTNSLGSYSCIAKNCMGEATSSAELTVEDIQNQLNEEERLQLFSLNQPPKFIVGLKSSEAKINEEFRFTIQVSISPEPSISWYRDDEQVEESGKYIMSKEMLGTCHFDIRSLEIIDQAEWKCVATNDFGHSVTSCFLKLIIPRHFKKPRFLECLRAILSEEGAVNLECKVIGVPQPVLKWYKDGEELKPGDIHRIISGQDGTCCLGTYTCEARNCMGIVASSASLLGFEERLRGAQQQKLDQTAGHLIARNPSLSTIHEERTSQMYDTPATEHSITADERAEVSFSFDGKEVSVSLYETPDLTEEEALQVVEMYADQLSEHVSEHNVVELPPLRFVKETSNTGKLLMEAVVIDVTHDAFGSAAEDDLRTDADLEEFSITDDNGQQAPPLPHDVEDDGTLFDKLNTEFLERALAPTVSYTGGEEAPVPKRPPRKKLDLNQGTKLDSDTFHSLSPVKPQTKDSDTFYSISPKAALSPREEEEDKSEHFSDAAGTSELDSRIESFTSARGSSTEAKAYQIAAIEQVAEPHSTKSSPPDLIRNIELDTRKLRGTEAKHELVETTHEQIKQAEPKEIRSRSGSLKKKMRSVESGLGRSFEESTEEKLPGELSGPRPERPARKGSRSRKERSIESGQGGSCEESGDERTSSEASSSAPKVERKLSQKRTLAAEVELIEAHMKKIQEQRILKQESYSEESDGLKTAKPGEIKRSSGKERRVSTEVQTEGSITKKRREPRRTHSVEAKESDDSQYGDKKSRILSSSSVDLPTLQSAESRALSEKGEGLLLESLRRSLQDIQKGLASVEEKVKLESGSEPGSAKSSLSVLEALSQPIQDSLALVDEQKVKESSPEECSPGKLLETISQPIQEFTKGIALVEQQIEVEMGEESLLERTSVSILENVAQPMHELQRDIALIQLQQQLAQSVHENIPEGKEEPSLVNILQPALQTITQSIHELQRGLAILHKHTVYEEMGEDRKLESTEILQTLSHPLHELRRGLAEVEKQTELEETSETSVGHSILEVVALPIQELQKGLELVEQQTVMETQDLDILKISSKNALQTLSQPIEDLNRGLVQIGQTFAIQMEKPKPMSGQLPVLQSLQSSVEELQHGVNSISKLGSLEETKGKQVVHEATKLNIVTSLAQPLAELQKCLINLEISEFKSSAEYLASEEQILPLDIIIKPLLNFQRELTTIEKQIISQSTSEKSGIRARTSTTESLIKPLQLLKDRISIFKEATMSSKGIKIDIVIKELQQPLKEFTKSLLQIEQQAVLEAVPKLTSDTRNISTAKTLIHSLQNIEQTITSIEKQKELQNIAEASTKTVSKLADLAKPLSLLKQGLIEAIENIALEETKTILPQKSQSAVLEPVVQPLQLLHKELIKTENQLEITLKKGELSTRKSAESLIYPIKDLKEGIISLQEQVTGSSSKSSIEVLESLVQPLQELELGITVAAPKESSILVLGNMAETVEALQQGVVSIEKHATMEAKRDPSRVTVSKLGSLVEPLKELQKELSLLEQKVQFEPEEELGIEVSSISVLQNLSQPLQELHRGIAQIEIFASEQHVQPLVEKAAEVLVEPILELQRGISILQQQSLMEADKESSKAFTILETLAQPLSELQKGLTIVEEQNVMILEEAPIFEKAKSLSSLEKVTQSVQDLQRGIATIEHITAVEHVTQEKISTLRAMAKPLLELHKGLMQVEEQIFEPGEKPLPDKASILTLERVAKPLQEFTKGLAQIEQTLILEPSTEFSSEKIELSAIESLARPLKALQKGIAVVQYQTALEADSSVSEAGSVFQLLAQPLKDLQKSLATVEEQVVIEPMAEPLSLKSSLPYEKLAQSVEGIHKGIALIEKQAVLEGGEEPISEKTAISILETIAQPLKELQKNLARVEHQVLLEKEVESHPGLSILATLANPVRELQKNIALIEEHAILEGGVEKLPGMTAITMVKAVAQPIHDIHKGLVQIQEQIVLEAREEPMSEKTEISILKTLATPIQQLQKSIAIIEQQSIYEAGEEPIKISTSILETLAQPLKEIHKNLLQVEEQVVLEAGDRSISGFVDISNLATIARPVHELQRGIALIQQQAILEGREAQLSNKSTISMLKTLAQPLQELQKGLAEIQQQVILEGAEELTSEGAELSLLKTLAHPIKQIQNSIAVIEQQVVYEPREEPLSEMKSISLLKTLAKPLHELQKNLIQIEHQVVFEARDEPISEVSISMLKTMAKPVQELQRGIALIQQQEVLEADDEELSDRTSMSLLQTLAQPMNELQQGIVQIQQQIALEAREEDLSDRTSMSILQTLANPIQEVHKAIALIQEHAVFEAAAEPLSEKTSVSVLQTLAEPVQELLKSIAIVEQQAPIEQSQVLSEMENISILKTLAQPIKELHRGLIQVEQQVALEARLEDIPKENLTLLETLAQPIQELQRGIALIEKQSVLETGEEVPNVGDLSLLKTLAKPLQELQRGIILIEQQEILEGVIEPLSDDATNVSDLPTLASTVEEPNFDMVHIEETNVLQGDIQALSDEVDVETYSKKSEVLPIIPTEYIEEEHLLEHEVEILQDKGEIGKQHAFPYKEPSRDTAATFQQVIFEEKKPEIKTITLQKQAGFFSHEEEVETIEIEEESAKEMAEFEREKKAKRSNRKRKSRKRRKREG